MTRLAWCCTRVNGVVAFFSGVAAPHHSKLPAYERELISLVNAIRHWQPYLGPLVHGLEGTIGASSSSLTSAS